MTRWGNGLSSIYFRYHVRWPCCHSYHPMFRDQWIEAKTHNTTKGCGCVQYCMCLYALASVAYQLIRLATSITLGGGKREYELYTRSAGREDREVRTNRENEGAFQAPLPRSGQSKACHASSLPEGNWRTLAQAMFGTLAAVRYSPLQLRKSTTRERLKVLVSTQRIFLSMEDSMMAPAERAAQPTGSLTLGYNISGRNRLWTTEVIFCDAAVQML